MVANTPYPLFPLKWLDMREYKDFHKRPEEGEALLGELDDNQVIASKIKR